jgi:hypothetical protein
MSRPIWSAFATILTAALVSIATTGASAQTATRASELPAVVQKAFQQAYPAATISATAQELDSGRTVYRVDSTDKGRRRIVLYDAMGGVVQLAEQVEEKELPAPVAAAMHSHPRAIYVTGMKVTRKGTVHYELTLRGTRKTAMVAKPDGTVVSFK